MFVLLFDKPLKNGLKHGRDAAMIPMLSSTLFFVRLNNVNDLLRAFDKAVAG